MMKRLDMLSGFFWLAIGLGLSVWTLTSYKIGSLTQPETGYLPLILGIILILLSLILIIGQFQNAPGASGSDEPAAAAPLVGWRVAYTVLVMVVAALFFEQVGYLLTFFALVVLLMKGVARQSWTRVLATALLTTVAVYIVFVRLLEVQLPRGFWGV
ncbi:MAG: tripartite tricarboxylate transporter TctB family protein [Deltaproteobacteria bacterium]|nr:tripartite tricarboxylate transporter TctB family protein [Deltaproteobacteria bacterium]